MREPVTVTLDTVFPLYLRISRNGVIEELSAALIREIGIESLGKPLLEAFQISRPIFRGQQYSLHTYTSHLFLFRTLDNTFAMRGQLTQLPASDGEMLMLVTPWLTWLLEHQSTRVLSPASFSALDAQLELQIYLSSQRAMMNDLHGLLDRLKQANAAALVASAAKSEFINHVSHELRTPLNGIIGAVEILGQSTLDNEALKLVDIVRKCSAALLAVINQILDYSKAASGSECLQLVEFDPVKLCQDVRDILAVEAFRMNASVILQPSPHAARSLCGDVIKIQDVLLRLVANAIKHASPGDVQIALSVNGPGDANIAELYVEVRDQGPGIMLTDRERIFEDFSTAGLPPNDARSASGLGLAIARAETRLLGGELGVQENPEGRGSLFWFKVPVTRVTAQALRSEATSDDCVIASRAVLLVDDNALNLQLARLQLESLGMIVDSADSGLEAVEKCRHDQYDLVFMDIQMPGLSGLETTRLLRALPGYAEVPIVAWTANASDSDDALYRDAQVTDTLAKPASKSAFYDVLRKWLS